MRSESQALALRKKKNSGQWLLLGLVLLTLGAVLTIAQWRDYGTVGKAEREQLRTQTRAIEESLTTQIRSADAALRTMLASMERWHGPEGYLPFAQEHLHRVASMMPGTRTFAVTDANGICQLSNRSEMLGQDFSNRDFIKEVASDKAGVLLHITPPFQSVLNAWVIALSRAIVRPNGEFGGVVTATLSPAYFEATMKNLRYAPDLRLTLIHDSGLVYLTVPSNLPLPKERLGRGSFFKAHLESGLMESEHIAQWLDGKTYMAITRSVDLKDLRASHSFVAVAMREVSAVYAPWRAMTVALLTVWLAMVALSCWALVRHQRSEALLGAEVDSAQRAMRVSHQRFEQMAQTIPSLFFDFEVSAQGQIEVTYISPYSQTLVGIAPEVLQANYLNYHQHIHPDDRPGIQASLYAATATRSDYEYEYRFLRPDGVQRWLKSSAKAGESARGLGATHFSGYVIDITDTKNQAIALHEMAYKDPLTQTDNRRSFIEKLQAEISRVQRYGAQASLLMLDIDFFKQVNDTYGHVVGDAVLKHLVAVLREGLRGVDTLGRLGGEEFAVLLPDTSLEAAVQLAERLRHAVQISPALEAGLTVPFTISLGVAPISSDVTDLKAVMHSVDKAMYHAKQTGRNRVCTAEEAPPTTLQAALD